MTRANVVGALASATGWVVRHLPGLAGAGLLSAAAWSVYAPAGLAVAACVLPAGGLEVEVSLFFNSREKRGIFTEPPIPRPGSSSMFSRIDLSQTESSLQKVAVWAAVDLVASLTSILPIDVYEGTGAARRSCRCRRCWRTRPGTATAPRTGCTST